MNNKTYVTTTLAPSGVATERPEGGSMMFDYVSNAISIMSAIVALWAARDARRSSNQANQINQEILELQKRDAAQRRADGELENEAQRILARAKEMWRLLVEGLLRREPFARLAGPQQEGVAHGLREGVEVPWEGTITEEMAVRLSHMRGVTSATVEGDHYRICFRFDPESFQLEG